MPQIYIDEEAKKLLDDMKAQLRKEGISNPTNGDALRRLAFARTLRAD